MVKAKANFCLFLMGFLVACQSSEPVGGPLRAQFAAPSPTSALQTINERALACWIQSRDRLFRGYALVPELDTSAGNPRILLVKKGDAEGLPQLVIAAQGTPVSVITFGPLTQSPLSSRINADISAWMVGQDGCKHNA